MPPSIPDRWIPYKACGSIIEGTRIICFKVPLRKAVQQGNKDINEIWDIKTLLRTIPKLGVVIDLTNTARYYNPRELQEAGVLYKKIYMPGRIIPPEDRVLEFMDAVDEFSGNYCEALVGVHCTHGLNRTGYMVCRYMRDRLGINGKEAIKRFEIARGYKIERDNYIADLIGQKPLPPDEGQTTELRPINGSDKNKMVHDTINHKKFDCLKTHYNGESWRDECKDENDDYISGRYVRHPNFNHFKKYGSGRNGQRESDPSRSYRCADQTSLGRGRRNRRRNSDSDRSDRSYDFRHDY